MMRQEDEVRNGLRRAADGFLQSRTGSEELPARLARQITVRQGAIVVVAAASIVSVLVLSVASVRLLQGSPSPDHPELQPGAMPRLTREQLEDACKPRSDMQECTVAVSSQGVARVCKVDLEGRRHCHEYLVEEATYAEPESFGPWPRLGPAQGPPYVDRNVGEGAYLAGAKQVVEQGTVRYGDEPPTSWTVTAFSTTRAAQGYPHGDCLEIFAGSSGEDGGSAFCVDHEGPNAVPEAREALFVGSGLHPRILFTMGIVSNAVERVEVELSDGQRRAITLLPFPGNPSLRAFVMFLPRVAEPRPGPDLVIPTIGAIRFLDHENRVLLQDELCYPYTGVATSTCG